MLFHLSTHWRAASAEAAQGIRSLNDNRLGIDRQHVHEALDTICFQDSHAHRRMLREIAQH